MEQTFLTELRIEKVRHLQDITIPLSKTERKNLILTGKNGSGKTSVLARLAQHINRVVSGNYFSFQELEDKIRFYDVSAKEYPVNSPKREELLQKSDEYRAKARSVMQQHRKYGFYCDWTKCADLHDRYFEGEFIVAFYGDSRKLTIATVDHIKKVQLKNFYEITDKPSVDLGKYLVDLESTKAFAQAKGDHARAIQITAWFDRFVNILRRIYGEPSLKLDFDIDTFQFTIHVDGREPFSFNTMSMGYAAVFDIVADLMMRMESQRRYDLEGIVLIDEIETHLHVELQKQIVPILTELFPNIQFILTTHSPFILNSAPNAVIYDLEKRILVEDGMENLSYEGIVDGYFEVDRFSQKLRKAFEEYKRLVTSTNLSDLDYARIAELEDYLDEVPDYLALDFAHEYSRLKAEFDS